MSATLTGHRIEALTEAISARFPEDKVKPGLVISALGDGRFYAAVRRYCPNERHSSTFSAVRAGGEVVLSVVAKTPALALGQLAKEFHARHAPPPVRDAFAKLKAVL